MFDRLEEVVLRHAELVSQQSDPEVAASLARSRELARKVAELEPLVVTYRSLRATRSGAGRGPRGPRRGRRRRVGRARPG